MPVDDMAFYVFAGCCYVGVPLLLTELVAAVVSAVRDWVAASVTEEVSHDVTGF